MPAPFRSGYSHAQREFCFGTIVPELGSMSKSTADRAVTATHLNELQRNFPSLVACAE